jgi:CheY-like chemotaxis protein
MALSRPTPARKSPARILIVDDDVDVIDAYREELEKIGYKIATASNGEVGLEKTPTFKPNLIILDLMMPKIDGPHFLEKLRANKSTFSIPVMIVSHLESELELRKCHELGIECYLIKHRTPVKKFVDTVRTILERQ